MGAGKSASNTALEKATHGGEQGEKSSLEQDLERQYEESRMYTHTARKV